MHIDGEPVRGLDASKIWSRVLRATAADEVWALDFFSHLDRVREYCKLHQIKHREPNNHSLVIPAPELSVLQALIDRFQNETFGARAGVLERAGLPVALGDSEAQILWSKMVRLNALACTTSASDLTIGSIRSDPAWSEALEACVRETAAVAGAEGASIDVDAHLAELQQARRNAMTILDECRAGRCCLTIPSPAGHDRR